MTALLCCSHACSVRAQSPCQPIGNIPASVQVMRHGVPSQDLQFAQAAVLAYAL